MVGFCLRLQFILTGYAAVILLHHSALISISADPFFSLCSCQTMSTTDETVTKVDPPLKASLVGSRMAYVCPFEGCGKAFKKVWKLEEHKYVHTREVTSD